MQCGELIYGKSVVMTQVTGGQGKPEKETIHSGHFMISHFEAEAQDDEDDLAVPVPEEEHTPTKLTVVGVAPTDINVPALLGDARYSKNQKQQLAIETSLTKLFRCMSLAYRQKLTSPKWNRFKGIKLRWKDKIRLNNVIWRCWHMQFIKRRNLLVCQFASPLDVDLHVKPETTILEGKYWKRRAEAVKAEYKKWRMFHLTRGLGRGGCLVSDMISDMETAEGLSACGDLTGSMLMDEDYIEFMSDTLFSTITSNQPFAFPDTREIARGANLADFIQPSLGPLQPNLDDYDGFMDTLEPLQELLSQSRLPPVPEECQVHPEEQAYASPQQSYLSLPSSGTHYMGHRQQNQLISAQPQQLPLVKLEQSPAYNREIFANVAQTHVSNPAYNMATHTPQTVARVTASTTFGRHNRQQQQQPVENVLQYANCVGLSDIQMQARPINSNKHTQQTYINSSGKLFTQSTGGYRKPYTTQGMEPLQSQQTALQQPSAPSIQSQETVVVPLPASYQRERLSRSRLTQAQYVPNQYSQYPTQQQQQHTTSQQQQPTSGSRDYMLMSQIQSPQKSYVSHTKIDLTTTSKDRTARTFKLPSPPLTTIVANQVFSTDEITNPLICRVQVKPSQESPKESFRSTSLPLGSQLNTDWTIAYPVSTPTSTSQSCPQSTARGGARVRSRSSGGGGGGAGRRVPPPLTSVSSEPALPQASMLLAHLLTSQHSQNVFKLSDGENSRSPAAPPPPSPASPPIMLHATPQSVSAEPSSPLSGHASSPRSPLSPQSPRRSRHDTHIHAEAKRRYNIKNGFDKLHSLIPQLCNNPNAKISKAAMLQKGAEYIKQLKAERNQIKEEMDCLRQQIDCLNSSISNCHSMLPATGAPVAHARSGRLRELFRDHVEQRTREDWKYWLFSMIAEPLVSSFSACASAASARDLRRTTLLWAEQHCSLVEMRPAVISSLRTLSTTTEILKNPERLPEEARAAVSKNTNIKSEPL